MHVSGFRYNESLAFLFVVFKHFNYFEQEPRHVSIRRITEIHSKQHPLHFGAREGDLKGECVTFYENSTVKLTFEFVNANVRKVTRDVRRVSLESYRFKRRDP